MKKQVFDDHIQVRCFKWMRDYAEMKGANSEGAPGWVRQLILAKFEEDKEKGIYKLVDNPPRLVAENQVAVYMPNKGEHNGSHNM